LTEAGQVGATIVGILFLVCVRTALSGKSTAQIWFAVSQTFGCSAGGSGTVKDYLLRMVISLLLEHRPIKDIGLV